MLGSSIAPTGLEMLFRLAEVGLVALFTWLAGVYTTVALANFRSR